MDGTYKPRRLFGRHCMTVLEIVSGFVKDIWEKDDLLYLPRWWMGVGHRTEHLLEPPLTNRPIEGKYREESTIKNDAR